MYIKNYLEEITEAENKESAVENGTPEEPPRTFLSTPTGIPLPLLLPPSLPLPLVLIQICRSELKGRTLLANYHEVLRRDGRLMMMELIEDDTFCLIVIYTNTNYYLLY